MADVLGTAYLILPLLGGGLFHGVCMKYEWLDFLAQPIDRGRMLRGRPLFGANKTWRGPVAVGLGAAAVLGLQSSLLHALPGVRAIELFDYGSVNGGLLGFAMGTVAMLTELPNSLLKRRIGVGPGQAACGFAGAVLWFLDQVDLLVGAWLVLALVIRVRLAWFGISVLIVVVVHQLLTTVTYALGMRSSPR